MEAVIATTVTSCAALSGIWLKHRLDRKTVGSKNGRGTVTSMLEFLIDEAGDTREWRGHVDARLRRLESTVPGQGVDGLAPDTRNRNRLGDTRQA